MGCYPEAGWFPDLKALAYQRDCLPQSTVLSTVNHKAWPFSGSHSAISTQQETIRSGSCCSTGAENSPCASHSTRRNASAHRQGHAAQVCGGHTEANAYLAGMGLAARLLAVQEREFTLAASHKFGRCMHKLHLHTNVIDSLKDKQTSGCCLCPFIEKSKKSSQNERFLYPE